MRLEIPACVPMFCFNCGSLSKVPVAAADPLSAHPDHRDGDGVPTSDMSPTSPCESPKPNITHEVLDSPEQKRVRELPDSQPAHHSPPMLSDIVARADDAQREADEKLLRAKTLRLGEVGEEDEEREEPIGVPAACPEAHAPSEPEHVAPSDCQTTPVDTKVEPSNSVGEAVATPHGEDPSAKIEKDQILLRSAQDALRWEGLEEADGDSTGGRARKRQGKRKRERSGERARRRQRETKGRRWGGEANEEQKGS